MAAHAQIILNGGFEYNSGTFVQNIGTEINQGGSYKLGSITHWGHSGDVGLLIDQKKNASLRLGADPKSPAYANQAYQKLSVAGGLYSLTFDSYTDAKTGLSSSFGVEIRGNSPYWNVQEKELSNHMVTNRSYSVKLNPGTHYIKFYNLGNVNANNGDTYIDNVKLVQVPEPSSTALLGLGGLTLLLRRKRG